MAAKMISTLVVVTKMILCTATETVNLSYDEQRSPELGEEMKSITKTA